MSVNNAGKPECEGDALAPLRANLDLADARSIMRVNH